MKTAELIRRLQLADPLGEHEVCVDNIDIFYVESMEAYWDGRLEVIIRDPSTKKAVGAKVTSKGNKIKLKTKSIEDCIWRDPQFPVDLSELGNEDDEDRYAKSIAETRKESQAYHNSLLKK